MQRRQIIRKGLSFIDGLLHWVWRLGMLLVLMVIAFNTGLMSAAQVMETRAAIMTSSGLLLDVCSMSMIPTDDPLAMRVNTMHGPRYFIMVEIGGEYEECSDEEDSDREV